VGKIPETRKPNPKNPSPSPKNPNPKNPNPNSGSNPRYPKLLRVIRVPDHGTRTTRITRTTLSPSIFRDQPSPAQPTKPARPTSLTPTLAPYTPVPKPRAAPAPHPRTSHDAPQTPALSILAALPLLLSAREGHIRGRLKLLGLPKLEAVRAEGECAFPEL